MLGRPPLVMPQEFCQPAPWPGTAPAARAEDMCEGRDTQTSPHGHGSCGGASIHRALFLAETPPDPALLKETPEPQGPS